MRGFSYIEIIVTIAIMALLATAAVPYVERMTLRQKEADLRHNLREIREAIDAYKQASDEGHIPKKINESGYPRSLEDLIQGIEDIKDPAKKKTYFLRRIPRDPMAVDSNLSAAETWGKRSYDSPPDNPQEGEDIFDIHSLNTQHGLNGVPYNQW